MRKILSLFVLFVWMLSACGGTSTSTTQVPAPKTSAPATQAVSTKPPSAPTNTSAPSSAGTCTDGAAFVADVTVPDNTPVDKGEAFTKTWRVRNTGTCTWTSAYTLVFASGEQMGAPDSSPLSGQTKPGDALDISVEMTAPSAVASYRADFEIHDPSGKAIPIDQASTLWVIVSVGGSTASSGGGATSTPGSGGGSGSGYASTTCAYTVSQANVDAVVAAINTYRSQNGLPAYTVNAQLAEAAQAHSADMACHNLFTHKGSDGSTPASRVAVSGYAASSVSENVYGSYPPLTGQGVVSWWATDQTDPNHNANLISTEFTEIGVGYAFFNNYGYYVVVFATPN
ncbi:MAG: hypothetical protein HYZ25_07850 [Chloroflexi bacterium]|nr:hypothetical protein [Chloroflexota bacterium]